MAFYDYMGKELIESDDSTDIEKKFKGKNVIWLADSLIDYESPEGFTVAYWFQVDTKANCYNWAQGGCCMALGKADNYDPYSFVGLVNALTTGVFTEQDEYAEDRNFTEQVNEMKGFNMETCDYMVVAYGTNDFWRNCIVSNEENDLDTNTFEGAIRYGIKTLLTKYPKIKLIFLNLQRLPDVYIDSGGITIYAEPYNNMINNVCAELSIPVVDIWNNSMINKYTTNVLCNGQPHLSHEGKLRYAKLIENALNLYF